MCNKMRAVFCQTFPSRAQGEATGGFLWKWPSGVLQCGPVVSVGQLLHSLILGRI